MIRECGSFWQRLFQFIPGQVNGTGEDEVMEWGGGVVVVVVVMGRGERRQRGES